MHLVDTLGDTVCGSADAFLKCLIGNILDLVTAFLDVVDDLNGWSLERIRITRFDDVQAMVGEIVSTNEQGCQTVCQWFSIAHGIR